MTTATFDVHEGNRSLDRSMALGRAVFVSIATLSAFIEGAAAPGLLVASAVFAVVASLGMWALPWHRPRAWWLRVAAFCDLCSVLLAIAGGISVLHLEEFASLNFAIILLAATLAGTQFRFYEVAFAALAVSSMHAATIWRYEAVSFSHVVPSALFNALLVWLWWTRPLRLHRVHAVRLYVHDMHGFLHSMQWALDLDTEDLRDDIRRALEDRIAMNEALERLLGIEAYNRRPERFDPAPMFAAHFPGLTPPPATILAPREGFAAAIAAIAIAAGGTAPTWEHAGRSLLYRWPLQRPGCATRNALEVASRLMPRPHALRCHNDEIELRLRLLRRTADHPACRPTIQHQQYSTA